MELVESRIVAVTSELNLELQFVLRHGKITDGARCGQPSRELSRLDHCSSFLAENLLVWHRGYLEHAASGRSDAMRRPYRPCGEWASTSPCTSPASRLGGV